MKSCCCCVKVKTGVGGELGGGRKGGNKANPGLRLTLQQLMKEEGGKERKGERIDGGRDGGREVCLPPPQPVSQSQRERTTGHNGALQCLAESCNLA